MPWRTGNGIRSMIKNTLLSLSLGVQWVRRPVDLRHRETLHGQIAHQVRFGFYPTAVAVRPHRLPRRALMDVSVTADSEQSSPRCSMSPP